MLIWPIEGSSGTYDNSGSNVVSLWSSKEKAKAEVERLSYVENANYTATYKRKHPYWYEDIISYELLKPIELDKEM